MVAEGGVAARGGVRGGVDWGGELGARGLHALLELGDLPDETADLAEGAGLREAAVRMWARVRPRGARGCVVRRDG